MLNNTDLIDFNKYANYSRLQVIKPNRQLGYNITRPTHTHTVCIEILSTHYIEFSVNIIFIIYTFCFNRRVYRVIHLLTNYFVVYGIQNK